MRGRDLGALILASALITLDGTAATVALPAIARDLQATFSQLQWISNAPLLMLASLLLPAGALADRCGRARVTRWGLLAFVAASVCCAVAPSVEPLLGGRALQGAGGALILPSVVAALRGAFKEPAERTRTFGVWAAWTGVASAVGPMLGGALADLITWRAVFLTSAALGLAAALLLRTWSPAETPPPRQPLPALGTLALILLFGGTAYLLIEGTTGGWAGPGIASAALLIPSAAVLLMRSPGRHALFPRELVTSANCLPANGSTFALYFGMFGVSFLLVLYTQQVLGYSGIWAGAGLLPVSLMLFLAEPFGRLAKRLGTRLPITAGSVVAASGILWMAAGPHPLPFWSRIVVGAAAFGLGVSMAVSVLTHAAVSAVPERCAGAASGLNHATVRAAGLVAIALLGSLAAGAQGNTISVEGFHRALVICSAVVGVGGVAGALFVRNEAPGGLEKEQQH